MNNHLLLGILAIPHKKKMKFSITDFISKCDQINSFQQIWSHLLKKSLMENFIFCIVQRLDSLTILILISRTVNMFAFTLRETDFAEKLNFPL